MKSIGNAFVLKLIIVLILSFSLTAGTDGYAADKLFLLWHMHQPPYFDKMGRILMPWTRLHATHDYVRMTNLILRYGVNVYVNFSGSLLENLLLYAFGKEDIWQEKEHEFLLYYPRVPKHLKKFFVDNYFSYNWEKIKSIPRYRELLDKRVMGREFSSQDIMDLVVLFNLIWMDRESRDKNFGDWRKRRHFTVDDLILIWKISRHKVIQTLKNVALLAHRGLITFTPGMHPILPIIVDSGCLKEDLGLSNVVELSYPKDAYLHIWFSKVLLAMLGVDSDKVWPAEGALSEKVLKIFSKEGIRWVFSDERLLKEIGKKAGGAYEYSGVKMLFRDTELSDKIGFRYSAMSGESAIKDFINYFGAKKVPILTVILDGENCWENFADEGEDFLVRLYSKFKDRFVRLDEVKRVQKLANFTTGSWIDANLATWYGEDEEIKAWKALADTRKKVKLDKDNFMWVMCAEASDWFWWYGLDQESGRDNEFDKLYRMYLSYLGGKYSSFLEKRKPEWKGSELLLTESGGVMQSANRKKVLVDVDYERGVLREYKGQRLIREKVFRKAFKVKVGQEEYFIDVPTGKLYTDGSEDEMVTYPTDSVFKRGAFDLLALVLDRRRGYGYVKLKRLDNPWKSPYGFSLPLVVVVVGAGDTELEGAGVKFMAQKLYVLRGWKPFVKEGRNVRPLKEWRTGRWIGFEFESLKDLENVRSVYVFGHDGYGVGIGIRKVGKRGRWNFGRTAQSCGNAVDVLKVED